MERLTEDRGPTRHGTRAERSPGRSAAATRALWLERLIALGVTTLAILTSACAPVIRPPETPSGFFAPPRVTSSGVLTLDGALVAGGAPTTVRTVPASLVIDTLNDGAAIVKIGPTCAIAATIAAPLYADVPGVGYVRRPDGALSIDRPSACAVTDGPPVTITAGTVVILASGAIELIVTGVDSNARVASLRFLGTRAAEADVAQTPPGVVDVHFLAELVTSCPTCKLNHRHLDQPGLFAFEPRLEQRLPVNDWTSVCASPCTARLDPRVQLRVGGQGLEPSAPFVLPSNRRRVVVKASATGTADRVFGWSFLGAGGIFVGLGAGESAVGVDDKNRTFGHRYELGGTLFALSSLAFIIPGLLVLGHQQTTITTDPGP